MADFARDALPVFGKRLDLVSHAWEEYPFGVVYYLDGGGDDDAPPPHLAPIANGVHRCLVTTTSPPPISPRLRIVFIVASILPSDDNEDNLLATTMVDNDGRDEDGRARYERVCFARRE